ncbi:MAG: DAK2 domain-containing protein [Ilumatobacter sp.]|uniref:DAK2 domain-containing protein n=1 Tax=Ilumatobacter sp. TaxID=1967498 RepID=UPI00261CC703|nr:DAK2 domain-containing protein [Ilumatobacter sp.]MDJ0770752.1 DAK2 domain-containing protein [Ilumatobacter sp.]
MPTLERLDVHALRDVITTYRDTVRDHAGGLNRLNVYPVPDGDTGTNMARTLDAVVAEMDAADSDDLDATCDAISHGSLMGARGNSGVILSQILRGLASTLKAQAEGSGRKVADALSAASAGAYQAVLKPIEGTILTVVRESAEAASTASGNEASLVDVLRAARRAGKEALDNTPELLPVLKDAGVVDAGGAGYLLFLDSALHVVDGDPLPEPDAEDDYAHGLTEEQFEAVAHRTSGVEGELDVSEQRYEVMYFVEIADEQIEEFKHRWGEIGDSIVVVGGDGLWNTHVHTNDIGAAIEVALELGGRPAQIRVTDLFEEIDEEHERREAEMASHHVPTRAGAGLPPVTTAVVAVCSGDGISDLFADLGVQGIVSGGQTLNPSTAELLDTVEHVNADQVVILPNNKNIIPVAEQVDELTTKSVVVVPTRTMPEALAALVVYDPEAGAAENAGEMREGIEAVQTGEVTQAVRDSNTEVGPVTEGDWMGIVKGDGIVAVDDTVLGVATKLLSQLLDDEGELLTIITGVDADAATTAAIQGWLADDHADVQVEVHPGGQPLYPYLFGVE